MQDNNNPNFNDPNQGKDEFIAAPYDLQPVQPAPPQKPTFRTRWLPLILSVFMLIFGFFGGMLVTSLSRRSRTSDVLDWMIRTVRENDYFYEDMTDAELEEVIARMGTMGAYYMTGDDYAELLSPNSFRELLLEMEGQSGGIAIDVWQDYANGQPVYGTDTNGNRTVLTKNVFVSQVYEYDIPSEQEKREGYVEPGEYSAQNQLRRFDRPVALEVNGEWVEFWNESYGSFWNQILSYPTGVPFRAKVLRVADRGNGKADYPRLSGGEPDLSQAVEVTLCNENYIPRYVTAYDSDSREMQNAGLPEDTLFLDFKSFMGNADEQFVAVMERFRTEGKKNLVLDLRYNGGGLLDILETLGSYLVQDPANPTASNTLVGVQKYRNGNRREYRTKSNRYGDLGIEKIIVLGNGNTASASEALIGAMDYYGTMTGYVGTTSYGKGIMQQYFYYKPLQVSYALKLTTAQLYLPDGTTTIHKIGFVPDDPATQEKEGNVRANSLKVAETLYPTGADADYAFDAQLAAALALLAA